MIDLRQTKEYTRYMEQLGWQALQLNESFVYLRKVPLVGCVAKMQRPKILPSTESVKDFCKKYNVAAFYLEPFTLPSYHTPSRTFKLAKNSFVPAKTMQIDVTLTEQSLLQKLKSKTRYNIGLAKRRGVVVKGSAEISVFSDLYKSASRERGMWLSQDIEIKALWGAFHKTGGSELLMAYKNDELLGGVLMCYSPDTAYYMYAGSTKKSKQLFAPTLLAWETIRLAKKRKKKIFDFEGVIDARYSSTKAWRGFTKFKEGFGGEVVEYPPTLVYYRNQILRFLGI